MPQLMSFDAASLFQGKSNIRRNTRKWRIEALGECHKSGRRNGFVF
jgi:hypothetical protein